jgi:hypothetical protein
MRRSKIQKVRGPFLSSYDFLGYSAPKIINGGEKPLPETREEVLNKYVPRLEEKDPVSIHYSNGEFISRSLILSKSFYGICNRSLDLESSSFTAFLDEEKKLWWREGGCFD